MRNILSAIAVAAGIALVFLMAPVEGRKAKTAERPASNIAIAHTEIFGEIERPQVVFDHAIHAEKYAKEGCKVCHPRNAEGDFIFERAFIMSNNLHSSFPQEKRVGNPSGSQDRFRTGRNDKINSGRIAKAGSGGKEYFMDAYHNKCIGCHTGLLKKNIKTGPVKCGGCHKESLQEYTMTFPVCEFDFIRHEKHEVKLRDDCSQCHHSYDAQEEAPELRLVYEPGTEESCLYCHDLTAKRGPGLSATMKVTADKGLSIRRVSHARCVNCHLELISQGVKTGPVICAECHDEKYSPASALAAAARPDRDQPEGPIIRIEDARMKGVPFDHKAHEKHAPTCRSCHHETLQPCVECHRATGGPEGRGVNIAGAYHDVFADAACTGCHAKRKAEKDCSGCHHHLSDFAMQSKGPKRKYCSYCHSGKKDVVKASPVSLSMSHDELPEEVTIKVLEKEYEPAKFPHREIVKKLVEISNNSSMATYFHRDIETVCRGCHHESDPYAEAEKNKPPHCSKCHALTFDSRNPNRPWLVAAYHRQCIGCHDAMGMNKTKQCVDCHKEKKETGSADVHP